MRFFSPRKWIFKLLRILYFLRHGWKKLRNNALDLKDVFSEFHEDMWREAANELSVKLVRYSGGFYRAHYGERSTWIQDYLVELDHHVTLQVARNKPLVSKVLSEHGIPVPPFLAFTLNNIASAKEFLRNQNAPCVVKPALESAGGKGVTTHVKTDRELIRAAIFASAFCPLIMIERQVPGDVYRFLYLDGELIDAIRRRPPQVIGDGRSTIRELIRAENKRRVEQSGHLALKVLVIDVDCRKTLKRNGLSLNLIPQKDQAVAVKTTTNESGAFECESILNLIPKELIREGARAAEVLGIRLAGIDVMTTDVSIPLKQIGGKIIEVNASPGLHYHYQTRNPEDRVAVAIPILRRLLDIQNDTEMINYEFVQQKLQA